MRLTCSRQVPAAGCFGAPMGSQSGFGSGVYDFLFCKALDVWSSWYIEFRV